MWEGVNNRGKCLLTLGFEGEILLTAGGGKQSYFIPNINVNI